MKIYETLERDPRSSSLANNGQARIDAIRDARAQQELRNELEMFVCDGQYGQALYNILNSFLTESSRSRQKAAWVSGFFGSGKSHLLKMLEHLWANTEFPDGAKARTLVRRLPDDVLARLRELDTLARRNQTRSLAAAGTLLGGSGDRVRLSILAVILRACGYPERLPQATFYLWLRDKGYLEHVRSYVQSKGATFDKELNALYVSPLIADAVLGMEPDLASDRRQLGQILHDQFPRPTTDITTPEFLDLVRQTLAPDGNIPFTALILDEVQQYIGESEDRSSIFAEVTEAIKTQLDSRVMVVASGQSALTSTPFLQKLRDRFEIRIQLQDNDVETVTRQVLLHKKPSAVANVTKTLDEYTGEISRHLRDTRVSPRSEDRTVIVDDYPLLPVRRRFWEETFRAVDAAGTQSQLRSQLRILDDALKAMADRPLGYVIPADWLYEAIAADLVNTGVLLSETAARIQGLDDGTDLGRLKKRLCGLIFLINKLPREAGADIGVRASGSFLSELMVDDLQAGAHAFQPIVESALTELAEAGILMTVGDEFRIQTVEGAEWDRAFRQHVNGLRDKEGEIAAERDKRLLTAFEQHWQKTRVFQGEAKVPRKIAVHVGVEDPSSSEGQIIIWLRDGWTTSQREVEREAQRRGTTDPIIHVFIPRDRSDDMKARIVEYMASQRVLSDKGTPQSGTAREARESMTSRSTNADADLDSIVREVTAAAKVFQGGGNEIFEDSLLAKIQSAIDAALKRMFPRFSEGDNGAWDKALQRARSGAEQPFAVVGWKNSIESHPVAREILGNVSTGVLGGALRKLLMAPPCGWPQDAIDAALIALHRAEAVRATMNGQVVKPGQLDQTRISTTEFRSETVRLGVEDKLALRGLYQKLSLKASNGDEQLVAADFLSRLENLARSIGGDPPLPLVPNLQQLEDLKRLSGVEQLAAIIRAREELEQRILQWTTLQARLSTRLAIWERLVRLMQHAENMPGMDDVSVEFDAIKTGRQLLDDADRVSPICVTVSSTLRQSVTDLFHRHERAYQDAMTTLGSDPHWASLTNVEQQPILKEAGLIAPQRPSMDTDEMLLSALDRESLKARREAISAISGHIAEALEIMVRRSTPEVTRVALTRRTLETEADVRAWLHDQETVLLAAIKNGPVVIA